MGKTKYLIIFDELLTKGIMEKFARLFFSMRMMALGMVIFLVAIALGTFLESTYDIQTAKILVYNALWFELLLVFLGLNLIANINRYKMWEREKVAMLMFHLSFIVILIGAGVTRYFSFEGLMLIRENAQTDFIYSSDPYLWVKINDGKLQYKRSEKMLLSEVTSNNFNFGIDFPSHATPISISYIDFNKNMVDSLVVNDSINGKSLDIVTGGMNSSYVSKGGFLMVGDVALSFDKSNAMPGIEVFQKGPKMLMKTSLPMRYLPMSEMQKARQSGLEVADSLYKTVPMDTLVPFQTTTLYQVGQEQFVFKQIINHSKMMKLPAKIKNAGMDILTIQISDGKETKIVELPGGLSAIPDHVVFEFNGLTYEIEYGSMQIPLPFAIACRDFQLDKYPGSSVASSFASEVTIIDTTNNYRRDQRIFMNNVMDYGGYRFFQSSYDPDEGGTRLSVNHDWWGTNITYLGYLLMSIGMILSLIAPAGRFRELTNRLKKSRVKREKLLSVIVAVIMTSSFAFSQDHFEGDGHDHKSHVQPKKIALKTKAVHRVMSKEHSDEVASLLVQDYQGRTIPFHTFADQILRKLERSNTYNDYNAVQAVMSMHMYPPYWVDQNILYVSSKGGLREKLKAKDGYISYVNLTDDHGQFILLDDYNKAHQRLESKRGEYDKQLIKLVERYQVMQSILSWSDMKILPGKNDPTQKWHVPLSSELMQKDTISSRLALQYLTALDKASESKKYGEANDLLTDLKAYQRLVGKSVVPSEKKVDMEISYNKMHIFKSSYQSYLIVGLLMLIVFFIKIFVKPSPKSLKRFKVITIILTSLAAIVFMYHGYGIYMRWYISGHAPWSNAYEAIVFIAWVSVLFGLIFSRKNAVILAGALILAVLMIVVSEMNLLDPDITPLQPVLKSYWLMIHVAIITGSYGPLGIACILAVLNLLLYIVRNKRNGQIVTLNINELTYVAEMTMTIGVFMLTIGTFLGGIWANESWGRYWGWDPKETWALVAVLVYAVILHLRYIPALKNKFTFNVASAWGYSSILFTFFGVNFYLVGLHSYAQGEGLGEIPQWIYWTILCFYFMTELASVRNKLHTLESRKIKISVFLKRAVGLISFLVIFVILFAYLGLMEFGKIIEYGAIAITVVIAMNLLMFVYSSLVLNRSKSN